MSQTKLANAQHENPATDGPLMAAHESDQQPPLPPVSKPARRGRGLRKWILRIGLILTLLLAGGAIGIQVTVDQIDRSANEIAEIGTSLNQFMKHYGAALEAHDLDALLALHDDNYATPEEGL